MKAQPVPRRRQKTYVVIGRRAVRPEDAETIRSIPASQRPAPMGYVTEGSNDARWSPWDMQLARGR